MESTTQAAESVVPLQSVAEIHADIRQTREIARQTIGRAGGYKRHYGADAKVYDGYDLWYVDQSVVHVLLEFSHIKVQC